MVKQFFINPIIPLKFIALLLMLGACKKQKLSDAPLKEQSEKHETVPDGNDHDDDAVIMEKVCRPDSTPWPDLDVYLSDAAHTYVGITDANGLAIFHAKKGDYEITIYDGPILLLDDSLTAHQDTIFRKDFP